MKLKAISLALVLALMAMVLAPAALPFTSTNVANAQPTGNLLTNIPVTGILPGGGTFEGLLSITGFAIQNGQLVVSGVLEGTATVGGVVTEITQTFTNIPVSLLNGGSGAACDILFLDLGPLNLDLLGLTVDLSRITLDVNAVPGAGNLLGNLLCAVAGLLDGNGPLSGILRLLDRINQILG